MQHCQVKGCRYPQTHLTIAHRCGTCKQYGHGQLECGNRRKITALTLVYDEVGLAQTDWCSVPTCTYRWSHTTEAHHCYKCGARGNLTCNCSTTRGDASSSTISKITIECPHCKTLGNIDLSWEIYTGAECTICMDTKKMVVFDSCKHANICKDCALNIKTVADGLPLN